MNRLVLAGLLLLTTLSTVSAQHKQITLEEIWSGKFQSQSMEELHSMSNGKQYTVLAGTDGNNTIDLYDYATLQKNKTLVSASDNAKISSIASYDFSQDERKLLIAPKLTPIYRHSRKGKYYIYDLENNTTDLLLDQDIQQPSFSPDGTQIAYVYENNLYIKKINDLTKKIVLTTDGEKNKIINGLTDWVYEEEFAFVKAYQWNATGDKIAYLRFDESEVPVFSMDVYQKDLYPSQEVFKYPKAGEKNSKVTLRIYDVNTQKTTQVDLGKYHYIPRILWTKDSDVLSVQTLNRHQNHLQLILYNTEKTRAKTVINEVDKCYIDIKDDLRFLDNNQFIWTSERSGYNHIYLYNHKGKLLRQITKGEWDVTNLYGYNIQRKTLYYQSTQQGSIYRDIYAVQINGKSIKKLSKGKGTHSAEFSTSMDYYINTYSNATTPNQYTLNSASDGKKIKMIIDNHQLRDRLKDYQMPEKQYSTIHINNQNLNMWMLRPTDFDETKKYPLFMTQYSGPGSQQVADHWLGANDMWYAMLAQQGYVVVCVDGRGTGFKGAAFKKMTYQNLGKYEVEDQISVAKKIGSYDYIDASRIGIWGWSYGGFMSSNCILKGNDVFSIAIAVAPVTSWRFYDSVYTERYMRTPQENPSGYDDNSPLSHTDKLKGKYLLIHGTADDNVHVQNTMRMVSALIKSNKQFDWAIYPDKNHGIYGGNTRLHLYTKMTNYIKNNL